MSGPREGFLEEKRSAWLYRALAEIEHEPRIAALFTELAKAAEGQASMWAKTLGETGGAPPTFAPGRRERLIIGLARKLGPRRIRHVLSAAKIRGLSAYDTVVVGHAFPKSVAQIGKGHRAAGGGNLRAAIFGVNDGLVSNASLILGMVGAAEGTDTVLATGVAGLLAGALSMAAGEFVSVRSQREMFEYQIGLESAELAAYPEAEAEELALIYAARGLPIDEARAFGKKIVADPKQALDVLAREELGLNPDDLGSPLGAAGFSFGAFTVGALVPLMPFLFGAALPQAAFIGAGLSAVGLFATGASMSLFTGKNALMGGVRMLGIGGGAGVATYLIGWLIGVQLG